jgi:hypothetical protein
VLEDGPEAWFTSDGMFQGHAYHTKPRRAVAGNQCVYRYPNDQEAAPIWFHDHVLGITRLNVYAGLAGAYDIVDPDLRLPVGLNPIGLQQGAAGAVELLIPLVIQDRMFDTNGQLFFPAGEGFALNPQHPYWVPEFTGDTIVVNGKVWPYLKVQAKRYRFLSIDGSKRPDLRDVRVALPHHRSRGQRNDEAVRCGAEDRCVQDLHPGTRLLTHRRRCGFGLRGQASTGSPDEANGIALSWPVHPAALNCRIS